MVDQDDTHRLIPSKYSAGSSTLTDLADGNLRIAQDLAELDSVTNDKVLSEYNRLPGINSRELVYAIPYHQIVNASFIHSNPNGSRFNGPDRGAWYAGFEVATSLSEIIFHRTVMYREIKRFADVVSYDDYLADFRGQLHDLRRPGRYREYLSPNSYERSQILGERLLREGSMGIVYPSVRNEGGTCLVCFRPALVANLRKGTTYRLSWNGSPEPTVNASARIGRNVS